MSVTHEEPVESDIAFSRARLIAGEAPMPTRKADGSSVSECICLIVDDNATIPRFL
jgi:hypothetical protein